MVKKFVLAPLAGAVILFATSMVSWMVLPFHASTLNGFKYGLDAELFLDRNTEGAGVYTFPHSGPEASEDEKKKAYAQMETGPYAFLVVSPEGMGSMSAAMVKGFINQLLAAILFVLILLISGVQGIGKKVLLAVLFAVASWLVCAVPDWNWWGFPLGYTLLILADLIVGWVLAGLAIGALTE